MIEPVHVKSFNNQSHIHQANSLPHGCDLTLTYEDLILVQLHTHTNLIPSKLLDPKPKSKANQPELILAQQ